MRHFADLDLLVHPADLPDPFHFWPNLDTSLRVTSAGYLPARCCDGQGRCRTFPRKKQPWTCIGGLRPAITPSNLIQKSSGKTKLPSGSPDQSYLR